MSTLVGFFGFQLVWIVSHENTLSRHIVEINQFAFFKCAQTQATDGHPLKLQNIKADFFEHLTDLTVFTLGDDDFDPVVFVTLVCATFYFFHVLGGNFTSCDGHTALELLKMNFGGLSIDFHKVGLGDFQIRMGHFLRVIAIVCQKQQAFGIPVETANGEHTVRDFIEKIFDGRAIQWVLKSRQNTFGLIQHQVDVWSFGLQDFALNDDVVFVGVDFGSEFVDFFAVDGDLAVFDQTIRGPTAGDSAVSDEFIESNLSGTAEELFG